MLALFPYTEPSLRDPHGSEALRDTNLVCRACRAVKAEVPELGLLTDVALDPYTSHGHDGLLDGHRIVNDPSVRVLRRITLDDAAAADELFSILMGEDVEARRSFITRNAKDVRFLDV